MADNINLLDAASAQRTVAGDEVAGILYQRIKRVVGPDGTAVDFLDKASRSDVFSAPGTNGTVVDVSAQGMGRASLQVVQAGGVTAWQVDLQVSLDGVNYVTVISHTQAEGSGAIVFSGANHFPGLYFRARCVSITGGTNLTATFVVLP